VDYFDYSQEFETSGFDIESFLEETQRQEKQRLEQELERVEDQLEQRETIHNESVTELESKLDWYIGRLKDLEKRSFGKKEQKQHLKQRINELYREIRKEKQQSWRDQQELEKERRELLKMLEESDNIAWIQDSFNFSGSVEQQCSDKD
jgi:chromosome segregation ATPase